jgi:2-polyprenyl-6-methoxyphenol hydroxylase-like FAD-dependent oxidoreductase
MSHLKTHMNKVLIVGGGIAGMSAAIRLREEGIEVDLLDKDPNWSVYGTGLTLSVLTFRALCDLGLGKELLKHGHGHDGVTLNDKDGNLIREVRSERLFAPDVPAEGGVLRPVLHQIMAARVKELNTNVKLGVTVESYTQDAEGVDVTLTDSSTGRYDFVIGADGLFSTMRDMTLDNAPAPRFTGQACWRILFDTPKDWVQGQMYLSKDIKVGFTPCSPTQMYMYLLEAVPGNPWREPEELPGLIKGLLEGFGGVVAKLRDTIDADTEIVYRPLESILIDGDWYDGRVALIGDTVHATTPHLGSGAGMAVEDAIVLVDELKKAPVLEDALHAFMQRRLPRGRLVVGNSLKLGELEMAGAPSEQQGKLMQDSMHAIAEPY